MSSTSSNKSINESDKKDENEKNVSFSIKSCLDSDLNLCVQWNNMG